MKASTLARLDHKLRPLVSKVLPPAVVSKVYSRGRNSFLQTFGTEVPPAFHPPVSQRTSMWGLTFQNNIGNAAGMFKNGEAYATVAAQGAGMYMAGTTTGAARKGNAKDGHILPFLSYPNSGAASNWLGLPNKGHEAIAEVLAGIRRVEGVPVAVSVMRDPGMDYAEAMQLLERGLHAYANARVDIIEINESCPNAGHGASAWEETIGRLADLASKRKATGCDSIPMVVKISPDTDEKAVGAMVEELYRLGFDGLNVGNTSTQYDAIASEIATQDKRLFEWFVTSFGGGVSGLPLRNRSLALAGSAVRAVEKLSSQREFHVIRTGGIMSAADIIASEQQGISFNQWYTGYFELFGVHGHDVYKHLIQQQLEM